MKHRSRHVGLHREGNPARQAAPSGTGKHLGRHEAEFRRLFRDFRTDCPLPRNDLRIVKGMHEARAGSGTDIARNRLPVLRFPVIGYNRGPVAARPVQFDGRSIRGHHDGRRDPEQTSAIGHALGMIAGRTGDHALRTVRFGDLAKTVEGAAELEGSGPL